MNESPVIIDENSAGGRVDSFIASYFDELSRSAAGKLIEDGSVEVNGKSVSKNYKLRKGDVLTVSIPEPKEYEILPENIPLDIAYEDDDLLVVNKPKGMVVHPAAGHYSGTLVNALMFHCRDSLSGINGVMRPGIVHRIDKDTSGLLIVAKNDFSHRLLADQIKEHSFTRKYQAVVYGNFRNDEGTVDAPIGRHPSERKKMTVTLNNSRNAVTHYRVLGRYQGFTHLELTLETGRTHQIRVHFAYIGHPLAGDDLYGGTRDNIARQALHCGQLTFTEPLTGEKVTVRAELPDDIKNLMEV